LRGCRCLVRAGCIAWPSLPGPAGPPVRSSATVTPVIVCAVSAPSGGFLGIQAGNCWSDHARDRPRQASVAGWPRPLPQGHCIAFPGLLSRKFVRAGRPRGGRRGAETREAGAPGGRDTPGRRDAGNRAPRAGRPGRGRRGGARPSRVGARLGWALARQTRPDDTIACSTTAGPEAEPAREPKVRCRDRPYGATAEGPGNHHGPYPCCHHGSRRSRLP
jgi:hypothetical protein